LSSFGDFEHPQNSNFLLSGTVAAQGVNSTMKLRMDKTLRFWTAVAAEHIKSGNAKLSKRQLVALTLREYERRGNAMRCLNKHGRLAWKATPRFLNRLADAERDARDDLAGWP
jgi:hypothetical protein